ncbi:MAG: polysaccharide deacetylase family protein [Treponema sp.]|jgi:peptidoglycan/xylan/chitin deacetylase (PgdA/CDA1 family)|nr:polysaccharide deacetylase family protein [Treponema sp.]
MILSRKKPAGITPCKLIIAALLAVLLRPAVFAKLNFSGLDLSDNGQMLFLAETDTGGGRFQSALLLSRLTDLSLQQLTAFPEKVEVIENGRSLQVRNAFGTLRLPLTGGLPRSITGFPAFTEGAPVLGGRLDGMAASFDGKWLLVVEPVTAAYGNLVLVDTGSGVRTVITTNIERPDAAFPARWSPDSRVFVYTKGGKLYYHSLAANASAAYPVDERYRLIGDGNTNSMYWSKAGDFFYIKGSTVYRVRGPDLFARSIYADFLEIGAVAGKIPFEFAPDFDAFWIAPDFRSLLLSKGGRNIFYFPLGLDDYDSDRVVSLPYLMLPRSTYNVGVLWSSGGIITVLAAVPPDADGKTAIAYRLNMGTDGAGQEMAFKLLEAPPGPAGALSDDGGKVVFWGEGGCVLYDYAGWRQLQTVSTRPVWDCLWLADGDLIMGDSSRLERIKITLSGNRAMLSRALVCLSSVDVYGYEEGTGRIVANAGGMWFTTDNASPWTETARPVLRTPSQVSGRYRVFLEKQNSGPYENIPMIRNIVAAGTSSLLRRVSYTGAGEEAGALTPSDGGIRELAVCFDLYDDATGLPQVLGTLRRYGIKATFFINGEFIRRFPGAVRDIVDDGHEAASMFFVPIDLSDSRYQINVDFISQGLARNEDEFYNATGRELALLWHPPYFALASEFAEAAAKAGYKTIGRDVDPMDWVTRDAAAGRALIQYSAGEMIDRIMDTKKPGSVIPVRLGLLPGGRQDYLYNRLGVLLDALIRGGYSVVPVSTLIEHAAD